VFFYVCNYFFFSSRRRHTRSKRDWSSDVCSSDLCKSRRLPRAFHVECRLRQVVPWVLSPVVVSEVLMQTCPWSPKVSGPRPEVSSRVRVPEALTSQAC